MFLSKFLKNLSPKILPSPFSHFNFSAIASRSKEDSNDATQQFFESVKTTIQGVTHLNYIVEHEPNLSDAEKANKKRFLVYKYDPSDENDTPKFKSYYVDIKDISPMYLDALFYIKDHLDPTLVFRRSCREGICGSCAMNCNGIHTLACTSKFDKDVNTQAVISPLGHMFVVRDLAVDLTNFYHQYRSINPYLMRKTPKLHEDKEHFQNQDQREILDGLYECILCACCSSSCPSYWWRPDMYLGPAALLQAYRWIQDTRDEYKEERLQQLSEGVKLSDCVEIGMCSVVCPKGLKPKEAIKDLFKMVRELKEKEVENQAL